jgi:molybdenum cofactor synthesis domain-containing protein
VNLPCSIALLVVSDRASRNEYQDRCEPAIRAYLATEGYELSKVSVVPDGVDSVKNALIELADSDKFDLILTAGGTGVSPRDLTPEATYRVIEKEIPGVGESMRAASRKITPHAILSRALAGVRGASIVVNLPGSPKGAVENLAVVFSGVLHGVSQAKSGDSTDCAPGQPV